MYGKIFRSIYDGTLGDNWKALITFEQMIVLCDPDGVIDMTPEAISRTTGIPIEHIKDGIKILESPDPNSRTPGDDGRRIIRLDGHREWGWYIVNHKKYKEKTDIEKIRKQNRDRQRKRRDKLKTSRLSRDGNAKSRHTDTDTDTDTNKNHMIKSKTDLISYSDDFLSFWGEYPRKVGKSKAWAAWKKIKAPASTLKLILKALEWQSKSEQWTKDNGQYIPHPTTYLNQGRWMDEPANGGVDNYGWD